MFVIFKQNLKRWLKYSNLTRRPPSTNEEIRRAMQEELNGSYSRVGFSKKILQLQLHAVHPMKIQMLKQSYIQAWYLNLEEF